MNCNNYNNNKGQCFIFRLKKHLSKPKVLYEDADVGQLMQLGFSRELAVNALEACNGDVNGACNMLLEYWSVLRATLQFYGSFVCLSVRPSVRLSVCLSAAFIMEIARRIVEW